MGTNRAGQHLKWCIMFSTIVEVASTFPAITEEDLTMLREVKAMVESEQFEDMQGIYEVSKSYGIVHGDVRTGKYGRLLSTLLHVSALTMGSKRPPDLTTPITAPRHRL